ncbi:hypothetical protein EDC96DRAFT_610168 [Choanephora cucurbitarum]|nr:hypothetical protein EDC96DRAFT_610168 [Choanephora cucurbitarum]
MHTVRTSIKNTDTRGRWRNKIKQDCTDRIRNARQDKINRIREDQWMNQILASEKQKIKQEHEEMMRREGILDVDQLIEESLEQDQLELPEEELENLDDALASYEASQHAAICISCRHAAFVPIEPNLIGCPNCGFRITESCLSQLIQADMIHTETCRGCIEYSLEPGTDNTINANCYVCDLWNMFYM